MKLPSGVRIGYRHYRVVGIGGADRDDLGFHGVHAHGSGLIRVCEDDDPEKRANTLLHEVFHGLFSVGVYGRGDDEELIVERVANGVSQLWQDNPELIAYLDWAFGED